MSRTSTVLCDGCGETLSYGSWEDELKAKDRWTIARRPVNRRDRLVQQDLCSKCMRLLAPDLWERMKPVNKADKEA